MVPVCTSLQASSLLSGSDCAQFVLLSAYIELASGKEIMMLLLCSQFIYA